MSTFILFASLSVATAAKVTLPVDVGIGPAVHSFTGPLAEEQLHTGLVINVEAIIDSAVIKKHKKKIPKEYRQMATQMSEVRISPSIFIPDTIFISPKMDQTGVYGISWRPVGASMPLVSGGVDWKLSVGARLTAAYIDSDSVGDMFFLRPGLDLATELEVPLGDTFLVSIGANAQAYIPQELGGSLETVPESVDDLEGTLWNINQAFIQLHYRFPYTVKF
jgi:hypothetical protein